jgi:sulfhydrogenase subunit gamma (sulfur reductase)
MRSTIEKPKSLYVPEPAKLIEVETLSEKEKLFRIQLMSGEELDHYPGQFVQVSIPGIGEAPISISSSPTRGPLFELGVRAVGNVTRALHRLQTGDRIGIRGPFGNGFPIGELTGRDLFFIAGGIGLFPLRSMIQYSVDRRHHFGKIFLLYGCREPAEELFRQELGNWRTREDIKILESADKCPIDAAWEGSIGVITTLFPGVDINAERTTALIVGPPVMYRYVVAECLKKGMEKERILLSLERRMKCGMGFCGHCQINDKYVCLNGPVFTYAELTKMREVTL